MVIRVRLGRAPPFHLHKRCRLLHQPPSPRYSSDFSHLHDEMVSRRIPYITDYITPTQSRSLNLTLQDFLPSTNDGPQPVVFRPLEESRRDTPLSPAHHLVYFPNGKPTSELLPDGTDPWHSPGPPFTRRMWAGGSMAFPLDIWMNGFPFHCSETIEDVQIRGLKGEEKIFVKIQRYVFAGRYPGEIKSQISKGRTKLPSSGVRVMEQRTLVFMRENLQEGSPAGSQSSSNVFKPTKTPDFSHAMIPTRELLFRFSALTFNAHAIHLDKAYCREVEGHRNLLVHGPLTVVLIVEVLQSYLQTFPNNRGPGRITYIEYRNVAPLYAEEQMRICVRRKETSDQQNTTTWDVWIEGRDGGYAVIGTVRTSNYRFVALDLGRTVSRQGTLAQERILEQEPTPQERVLEQESIPRENINLQSEANATRGDEVNEDGALEQHVAAEETRELKAEEAAEKETEKEGNTVYS